MPPRRSKDAALQLAQALVRPQAAQVPISQSSSSICIQCRRTMMTLPKRQPDTGLRPLSQPRTQLALPLRNPNPSALKSSASPFTTSSPQLKKQSSCKKSARKSPSVQPPNPETVIPDNAAEREREHEIDPYDFSDLNNKIAKAIQRLKDGLLKTRDAGRVTPQMVEGLPVEINVKGHDAHGAPPHKERMKIGDLASVTPRGGRMMQVFCAEQAHVKPICSSILGSPYSLVPQVDANNPLLVLVPVPPMTAETRAQARAEAKKVYDRATLEVRNARGDAQKRFRKMENQKLVIVDELHKAHKQMEEIVRKAGDECKKLYEGAVKAMEG
ncbi:hypothetical protein HRR83_008311 [Exophiala dermatitidis]|uniref:Ribosome recycling factor n=2 Tax=Exophiala dermatitidis TaxID=5970 RepID=H6C560_EXODN|nr:ribosome recycling factor [Exophiala dermatitidis NIH/UT8656]KAJ4505475.1 hypothetical protein HRR75_007344 [Exophiala dermatitidis]EHY59772.1 ribosome recycling factor [Exophiala dermatitidis NIH/UT8656]KAJ4507078.1 hypothetical protein HRR73_007899 [Exophiala dermatitidis]KAJ4507674.1 hypothetical protein HRR74_008001 [Exophiala dermatitidis]KAJ4533023.1 hypothetical protein HRR76_007994 [Exophiala dermatitidis]